MKYDLNFSQLQAFMDVAELGSFSSAGRRRNLTQPAVSLRVKQLELQLGVQLVERNGRRVRATAVGGILYEHARRIDGVVNAALEAVADHRGQASDRIVIAAGSTASVYLLPPRLGALRQASPRLKFVVQVGSTIDIMNWIDDDVVDFAIVSRPLPGRMLDVMTIQTDELVLISPFNDSFRPRQVTAALLAQKPLITPPAKGGARRMIDPWFEAAGLTCRPIMELGSVEAVKQMVAAGLGYGIVPRISITGDQSLKGVTAVSLYPRIYRELALVIRQDKHISRALREVLTMLQTGTTRSVEKKSEDRR